jgi:hypothetical protein
VGVGRSGEGGQRRWCGFNASVWVERGCDRVKRCWKMKRWQRAHLGSMGRKRDTTRLHDDVGRRRGDTGEGKERR